MVQKQVFLIQSSGKTSEHITAAYPDRTYADEVTKHGYYRHENWEARTRDLDFGKVKVGDYVFHYCTNDAEPYPGQIKNIYEVMALEAIENDVEKALKKGRIKKEVAEQLAKLPHILRLRLHVTLNKGLELATIRKWVEEGALSSAMNNCGRIGFNICQVDWNDYETIMEWNKSQPPEAPTTFGAILEEDLRRYIASQPSIESMFGEAYKGYELYKEPDGRITGELYDTKTVGQIDLLYQNENGDFLVIELKRTEDTPDKVVGQIARYLGWVQDNIGKNNKVQGLLVTRSASEELKYASKALVDCKLCTYEIQFKFSHVS